MTPCYIPKMQRERESTATVAIATVLALAAASAKHFVEVNNFYLQNYKFEKRGRKKEYCYQLGWGWPSRKQILLKLEPALA